MTARDLYKKNLPLIEAWANGAEVQWRHLQDCPSCDWTGVLAEPDWANPAKEWRVKPESPNSVHFIGPKGPVCGAGYVLRGLDWDWSQVTCAACLAKKPGGKGEPPEGYRLLGPEEPLRPGDLGHWGLKGWMIAAGRGTMYDAYARKTPEVQGAITAASELDRQERRIATLQVELDACRGELEIVRQDRDHLCMCAAQTVKPLPRPRLPDIVELRTAIDRAGSAWFGDSSLCDAIEALVKHLTP